MALEAITWVSDLVVTNPISTDFLNEGDDHIKGIKNALKNTFPNLNGAVTATPAELNKLAGFAGTVRSTSPIAGEWVLLAGATITGTPATIDLITGTGGVDFSTNYDQYLLELMEVQVSNNGSDLRLQMSVNAGVTFPANATGSNFQRSVVNAGTETNTAQSNLGYVDLAVSLVSAVNGGVDCLVRISRPAIGTSNVCKVSSEATFGSSAPVTRSTGTVNNSTAQFNALRLLPSVGTFTAGGRYRLFGRKV